MSHFINKGNTCNICSKSYCYKKTLDNHIYSAHNINNTPSLNNTSLNNTSLNNTSLNNNNIQLDDITEWDKDQIDLALELSMKEQFKDFIPNPDDVLEMSSNKACIICLSKKTNVAFINCGHMVSCEECAEKLKNRGCPVCRKKILKILKIYT
jgi:hypothetical protein